VTTYTAALCFRVLCYYEIAIADESCSYFREDLHVCCADKDALPKLKEFKGQADSDSKEEIEEQEGVALELFAGHTPLSWKSDGERKVWKRRRKKRKLDQETRVLLKRQEVSCFSLLILSCG